MRFKRGDAFAFTVTISDADGTALNLTGATVYFTVRTTSQPTSVDDSDAIIAKSVTSHTDAVNGITSIPLTASDTNKTPMQYYREIQVKFSSSSILSTATGTLEIVQDLTKSTS